MFHEKLRNLRKQKNMSQEELANQLDISRQSVSKWESGLSMPDLENVIKLSELFEVSLDYLLKDRKSESEFNYYTVDTKEKKAMSKINILSMITLTLSIATILTLIILSIAIPHVFSNLNTGKTYSGFLGYYYSYIEFKLVAITSFIALILSILILIIPDKTIIKYLSKKI
ncbi:MAG: helix-turn-helix transcriptional regulator [Tenericutes bacterium]|nr:helix-turn-helix transcriptional regulator [Mycoplasmatota bacterium]